MALTGSQREQLLGRITNVSDTPPYYKMMLFGEPGVGKTTLAAQLSESSLFIMSEWGDHVLKKDSDLYERTKRVPFTSFAAARGYCELMADGTLPYTQLVLDNASGIQDKKLSQNMEDKSIKDNPKIGRVHPDLSTQQDYQIVAHQMRPMIVDAMDLEKDVTLICHTRPKDPERGEFKIRPDLTKAIFNLANEKANMVVYMHKGRNGERLVQTNGTDGIIAKSQLTSERVMTVDQFIDEVNQWRNKIKD